MPVHLLYTGAGGGGGGVGKNRDLRSGLPPVRYPVDSRSSRLMWVEFAVGSRPCSEGFLHFQFQFDNITVSPLSKAAVPNTKIRD